MTLEQRSSYRCPNVDDEHKAVIRIGQREVVVALTNQSAGGCSVVAKGKLRVCEGKTVQVRTPAGWFQAQVIHKYISNGQTTLGLNRLADLPDPRDARIVKTGGLAFEPIGSGTTSTGSLLMFTIVAGIAFWGFMLNFAWLRGPDGATGTRVDMGGYVSRTLDRMTSRWNGTHSSSKPSSTEDPS